MAGMHVYDEVVAKKASIITQVAVTLPAMTISSSYTGNFESIPILDSKKREIGFFGCSGITFTGNVFVTEVNAENEVKDNGDYYVNYANGYYSVLAATGATPTATYYVAMTAISSVVDVELGAVEIKNAASDDRAEVSDANTARAVTSHVLTVQHVDSAGHVLDITNANTSRTTGTTVLPTQYIDATGKVSPAGEVVGNAPFVKLGDGTDTLNVLSDNVAFPTGSTGIGIFGRYQVTPSSFDDGDAAPILLDSNGRVVLSSDIEIGAVELKDSSGDSRANINVANTVRTTGTTVLAVQEIGADGTIPPTGSLLTNAPFVKITDATTNVDILPLVTGTTSSGLLSVAGEIVDFDTTALEDPTPSIGILGMSSVGAKPILVDASGRTNVDIATQTLTAVKVSKDANANAVGNPIFAELSNGSSAFTATITGTTVSLDVNIVSSTLPSSAATEATLSSIDTSISNIEDVIFLGVAYHNELLTVTSGYTSGTCQSTFTSAITISIIAEGDDDIVFFVVNSVNPVIDLASKTSRYKIISSIVGTQTIFTFLTPVTVLDFLKRNSDEVKIYIDAFA